MRILLTGGAGFIGTHLAERLCVKHDVVLFDNFRRDSLRLVPGLSSNPKVKLVTGDVLDTECLAGAMKDVDCVLHLAAIAGVSSYYEESLRTLQVNIIGTNNVLEAAVKNGVRQFLHFSTSETYGPDALWVTESSPHAIGPVSDRRWVYATSKLAGEHLTLRTAESHGFFAAVVRPFNVYGPRQTGEGAISNFCRAGIEGRPLRILGDGSAIRAWCYVADFVDAIEAILSCEAARGQVFNIGNPREVETTLGLARRIKALISGTEIEFQEDSRAEVRVRIPSIAKARQILSFEPRVCLDQGLDRTINFYRGSQA